MYNDEPVSSFIESNEVMLSNPGYLSDQKNTQKNNQSNDFTTINRIKPTNNKQLLDPINAENQEGN